MTVSDVFHDARRPLEPWTFTVRYGRTLSLVAHCHWPSRDAAEEAASDIRTNGLDAGHYRR